MLILYLVAMMLILHLVARCLSSIWWHDADPLSGDVDPASGGHDADPASSGHDADPASSGHDTDPASGLVARC